MFTTTENNIDVYLNIMSAARLGNAPRILEYVLVFKRENVEDLSDFNTYLGLALVEALSIALKKNDQRTMIVLFSKKRAKHLLKASVLKSPTHIKGRKFLKDLACLDNPNSYVTGKISSLQTSSSKPLLKDLEQAINTVHDSIKEALSFFAEKQSIMKVIANGADNALCSTIKRKM